MTESYYCYNLHKSNKSLIDSGKSLLYYRIMIVIFDIDLMWCPPGLNVIEFDLEMLSIVDIYAPVLR